MLGKSPANALDSVHEGRTNSLDPGYLQRLVARGPMYGMQLVDGMLHDAIAMSRLQIQRECSQRSEREQRIEAARRLYFDDPAALRLLDRMPMNIGAF